MIDGLVEEIRHFHLFCGIGGGALGFNRGRASFESMSAHFRCIGGVDVDAAALRDFKSITGAAGTLLDMFSREDYEAFHGHPVPAGWRDATPDDLLRAAGGEHPNLLFLSAPCKGYSGLLSTAKSTSPKYRALNRLALRGLWLALEAFADDLPEFVLFENVPRIAQRGRGLLDEIESILAHYGYASAETTHDCGELGGLGQTRKRFLLVARNRAKVPPFLYEPPRRPLRTVGEIIGPLPLPGDPAAGPMHAIRNLQFRTWVRLAFVEAGKDWRSLERLSIADGKLADYALAPVGSAYNRGYLGVREWDRPTGTVCGQSMPSNGAFAIADPRFAGTTFDVYGVQRWDDPGKTVTGQSAVGGGRFAVADPRYRDAANGERSYNNVFRVVRWDDSARAVTGGGGPTAGGQAIADPRWAKGRTDSYGRRGIYGVLSMDQPSGSVIAHASVDTGAFAVADPRLPEPDARMAALIIAEDGTWHRPLTTLELAALQGFVSAEEHFALDGRSDSAHRERIGNAVPPPAAEAIASVMGHAILLARAGETFELSSTPVWVRPFAIAASMAAGG